MTTERSNSRQILQGSYASPVVKGSTIVEVAARLPLTLAVVVAVIISIIVLLSGSG